MRPPQEPDVFHAVAHPVRRAILLALRDGERGAGELAAPFAMTLGAVSQHLRALEEAGLVDVRRDGTRRLYRLTPAPLAEVAAWVDAFVPAFGRRLDALGAHLDREARARDARAAAAAPAAAPREAAGTRRRRAPPRAS